MLQIEPIQNFNGFGTGNQPGEYFFSQNLVRSQFGVAPKTSISEATSGATLSNLNIINWFSEGNLTSDYVYAFANDGRLFRSSPAGATWTQQRAVSSSHGNGLIFDQTNRLLYANDAYLGKTSDGSTFTDNWKDFGVTYDGYRPMDTYEDWVVIGNKNTVALLNVTDDSWNATAFDLPSGFKIRCIKSGRNGVLIGANFNNRGVLILWEPNTLRAVTPWIWRNRKIQSIVTTDDGWIVITQNEILATNGYSVQKIITEFPDYSTAGSSVTSSVAPQGAELQENKLMFWGFSSNFSRQKAGLYILNLSTRLLEFLVMPRGVTYSLTGGAIFTDSGELTNLSYGTSGSAEKYLGALSSLPPTRAYLITEPMGQGDNEKIAEGIKLTFGMDSSASRTPPMDFTLSVKIANKKRNIFGRATTRAVSTSDNILKIDGTQRASGINYAEVGDEVTILEGVNAGQVRHITNIYNKGLSTEEWMVDSALPNFTEQTIQINVSPFKLVNTYTFSDIDELIELYFDVQNRLKGKKFHIKILIEGINNRYVPELMGGQFIYDDLGVKR